MSLRNFAWLWLISSMVTCLLAEDQGCVSHVCGSTSTNNHVIDLTEPKRPGPFHDLTKTEMIKLREFLEKDPNIRAANTSTATLNSSYIYMADLYLPKKSKVLNFLDNAGKQPGRYARVMVNRGDLDPPVVEEYVCGPLHKIIKCKLMVLRNRRNPVEFSVRPFNQMEMDIIDEFLWRTLDAKIGHILRESYNASVTGCDKDPTDCLTYNPVPMSTGLLDNINQRKIWLFASFDVPFYTLHPVDFGVLCKLEGSDPRNLMVEKIWYAGRIYDTVEELVDGYNAKTIPTVKVVKPKETNELFSTLYRRGQPLPKKPQRAPVQVEPDGKRYSLKHRKVEYMGWTFNFRMSALTGPVVYDVRFKGERIAYEIGVAEIAVFYSGKDPLPQITNYVDSGVLLGSHSKSLVPGGDCPEFSTLVNQTFWSQHQDEPGVLDSTFCLFEINNGYPLRRHSSYEKEAGSFYGGMLDSVLTLRSALTLGNYDYIIDFIFHQNGILEFRLMSTGYILPAYYANKKGDYGFRLHDYITGSLHHHMAHFKVDLDVGGTSNRYETLDVVRETVRLKSRPHVKYYQNKVVRKLKTTEKAAVYDYHFKKPKYLLVHNDAKRTKYNQLKGFRIQLNGISYNLLPRDQGNERTIPWARHQMVVTRHKDDEIWSSSNYGMFDGLDPVVNFTKFYDDDEDIVDKDLVFWLTGGMHHIPHTEDLPVTPSVGNHLTFFLLPYNYFDECPSMGSRDAMYIKHIDPRDPTKGVTVDRNGNSRDQCVIPKSTLEETVSDNPDLILESRRKNFILY
ncbi:putative amine oxidase [copper-containing] [Physella acuta]|uniref:putative amine oxidase [copper-containing] n=1 Tax=Physella acuta TaxID=109671 RepID=UPI0027DE35ED|nr:putative amine oxidase [copper-containing] [Physella acuta]XP_059150326.1 putative amine oxidase [copper-containing] [Physella acuta]XP_059150327.1 putative amine oxidase [copper-containing] [Physella acuta]